MPKKSKSQKKTTKRVMHEFKHGDLKSGGSGKKVKSRRQAIAIAMSEAGTSKYATPKENKKNQKRTRKKEGSRKKK